MIRIYQSTTGPQIRAVGLESARVIALHCHGMPIRDVMQLREFQPKTLIALSPRGVTVPQIPTRRIVQVG